MTRLDKKTADPLEGCGLATWILSLWLEVSIYQLYRAARNPRYHQVSIPKKGKPGKFRVLNIPQGDTLTVAEHISERVLSRFQPSIIARAYVKGRDVKGCVSQHLYGQEFIQLDFQDAFPSVSWGMVYYMYLRELKESGLLKKMLFRFVDEGHSLKDMDEAWLLAGIARVLTCASVMPRGKGISQGIITSPAILNQVALRMDKELIAYCTEHGFAVTRYSDDVVVSSPGTIPTQARRRIRRIFRRWGFTLNPDKTRYHRGQATEPRVMGLNLHLDDSIDSLFPVRQTRLTQAKKEQYRNLIHRAMTDTEITPCQIKGVMDWCLVVYDGKLPERLRKPLSAYFRKHDRKIFAKYTRVLSAKAE
jgi:hypothetical protein